MVEVTIGLGSSIHLLSISVFGESHTHDLATDEVGCSHE